MPDRRTRPSALTPFGGLLSLATAATSMVLGKDYSNILLYSTEKAIMVCKIIFQIKLMQDEIDEQLRILNERGIKENELR